MYHWHLEWNSTVKKKKHETIDAIVFDIRSDVVCRSKGPEIEFPTPCGTAVVTADAAAAAEAATTTTRAAVEAV